MSIQRFGQDLFAAGPFVDKAGVLTVTAARFVQSLFNRTGAGTGIVPKVTNLDTDGAVVATGATIGDAVQLTTDWNIVSTALAGSGVQILPLKPGNDIQVYNAGPNALKIYPPAADIQIDALGNGVPFSLAAGKLRIFECWTLNRFQSLGN